MTQLRSRVSTGKPLFFFDERFPRLLGSEACGKATQSQGYLRAYLLPCTGFPSGPVTLAASRP